MEVKGTEWEGLVEFSKISEIRPQVLFKGIEVANIDILNKELPHLKVFNCSLTNCSFYRTRLQSIRIYNSTIQYFSIKNSIAENFTISDSSYIGPIIISENSIIGNFDILGNSAIGNFSILRKSKTGNFQIIDNSTIQYFSIEDSTVGKFLIENSKIKSLKISSGSIEAVELRHVVMEKIEIIFGSQIVHFICQLDLKEPMLLFLKDSEFAILDFSNSVFPEFATLNVSSCSVNRVLLDNFCNYGSIFFSRLTPLVKWRDLRRHGKDSTLLIDDADQIGHDTTLRLINSDLGKVQFINCDLRKFQRFEFSNTKMLDVFVAESQMPDDAAFFLPAYKSNQIAEQKRLAYGQFKKIYEARGDQAWSLRYLAYEMKAYREQLRKEKLTLFSKEWFDNRSERWILWLNHLSTNYGNNWLRGALVTFAATGLCFAIFCLSLGYRPGTDVDRFLELTSYAPQYLNPFRDEDSVIQTLQTDGMKVHWYSRIWDYLSRIIVAYFVYQTIQAFRKLGKSSG